MKTTSRKQSYIKQRKIFLNCMNSWFSNFIIEEFRTDYLPDADIRNVFMGTVDINGHPLPRLFEPIEITIQPDVNYNNQKIFENDIIIYNLDNANLSEVEFVIRGLKNLKYEKEKMLIIISNIMTWAKTPLKIFTEEEKASPDFNEEEVPEVKEEEIKKEEIKPIQEPEKVEEKKEEKKKEKATKGKAKGKKGKKAKGKEKEKEKEKKDKKSKDKDGGKKKAGKKGKSKDKTAQEKEEEESINKIELLNTIQEEYSIYIQNITTMTETLHKKINKFFKTFLGGSKAASVTDNPFSFMNCSFIEDDLKVTYKALFDLSEKVKVLTALTLCIAFFTLISGISIQIAAMRYKGADNSDYYDEIDNKKESSIYKNNQNSDKSKNKNPQLTRLSELQEFN